MRSNPVQEKSFAFALNNIQLYKKLAEQHEYVISRQLLRAGTSIGRRGSAGGPES